MAFDESVNFGDSVQLTCHVAKGDLPLKIKWLFNQKPLFAHLNILTSKLGDRSSFLTIPSVTAENSGNYTCAAWNAAGEHNFTAKLNVEGMQNTYPAIQSTFGILLFNNFLYTYIASMRICIHQLCIFFFFIFSFLFLSIFCCCFKFLFLNIKICPYLFPSINSICLSASIDPCVCI